MRGVHDRIQGRLTELVDERRPFVRATVVRAQCPTSARPGDTALVVPDGSIEGFVGGQCAEGSVRTAALEVLATQDPKLLRILPAPDAEGEAFPEVDGADTVVNPCLSGGALEIFLEPHVPAPRLVLAGVTPIVDAVADFAPALGFDVAKGPADAVVSGGTTDPVGALAVIVASHGRDEDTAIRAALDAGVPFVGLVASPRRAALVLDALELSCCERGRIHAPVGIDIGARTAEEIALSILAGVVAARRRDGIRVPEGPAATATPTTAVPTTAVPTTAVPTTAIDPVCGMTVTVVAGTPHLEHDGEHWWFCNPGCRVRHAEELGVA